jgi:hypothetical protein
MEAFVFGNGSHEEAKVLRLSLEKMVPIAIVDGNTASAVVIRPRFTAPDVYDVYSAKSSVVAEGATEAVLSAFRLIRE